MNKTMQLKARIKNLAVKNRVPAQAVLQNYMLERLLERISVSIYKDKFILKGGLLIASLVGIGSRTTMDMDATLKGYPLSEPSIRELLINVCEITLDDGVTLHLENIHPIREDDEYGGYRVSILARYESINTPLKIDITTGDLITPGAVLYEFQSIFENKQIEIWAYNTETILAEKIETILRRSILNTRLRDFYDVYLIMKTQGAKVKKESIKSALTATSQKRMSTQALQDSRRILLTIQADTTMRQRWERYCRENYYAKDVDFDEVMKVIADITS